MGYDILSNTTPQCWSCHHDWGCFLDLAEAFGWVPEPRPQHVPGHDDSSYYIWNDRQKVSDADAQALDLAIDYMKDAPINMKAGGTTLKTFDAEDITHLRALATLAGTGGFTIA
jgi:hypothetical protein